MYDRAFFDHPIDRRGTACEKWDSAMARDPRVTNPMWVADMDFRCPDEVVNALRERAAHPIYGYTEQTESAVAAMLGFMERRHGLKLTSSEQIMLPCVVSGLKAAVLAFTQPGDRIIVQPPVYGPFYASVRDNGREAAECPLKRDEAGRYTMDLESVKDACRAGARMMFLCSPHNPVGRVWSREELKALLAVLARYDVLLLSDEIHEDFVSRSRTFVPVLDLAAEAGVRAISMTSASKTFNLAGLQQAAAFCRDQALLGRLEKTLRDAGVVSGNIFGMAATEAAFAHGDAWLDAMLDYVAEGYAILREEVEKRLPGAVLTPLEATYLGWLDLRAWGLTTAQLMERTRAAGVEFTPGTFFGEAAGEGFLRVNLACPHERVRLAAGQIEQALK